MKIESNKLNKPEMFTMKIRTDLNERIKAESQLKGISKSQLVSELIEFNINNI